MHYHINTTQRYRSVVERRALKSLPVKTTLAISVGISILGWSAYALITTNIVILGITLFSTGLALGFLIPFTLAATYFPYIQPPKTLKQLAASQDQSTVNLAPAATIELIEALGRHAKTPDKPTSLARVVSSLVISPHLSHMLNRLQIDPQKLYQLLNDILLPNLTWLALADRTVSVATTMNEQYLRPEHVVGAMLLHPNMQASMRSMDLAEKDIRFSLWWESAWHRYILYVRRWWDAEHMLSFTGIGLSWASGYTPFVDRFARLPKGNVWDDVLFGHEEKIDELINTLARQRQSNVLLVGDPGVGRIGIVRELSRRVISGRAHQDLNGQRVLYINIGELIAQGSSGAGQLSVVNRALREMERAGNIIAIIDGLSSVLGGSSEQRINLTDILSPFLSAPTVRVVVITSTAEYHLRMKSNPELIHYFEVVLVPSLSIESTMQRLALTTPDIERRAKLYIPYKSIRTVVQDTASIMPQVPFPERAYDFLEEAIVLAQNNKSPVLLDEHIHTIIQHKIGINLGALRADEGNRLLNLEKIMHRRLINQDTAVKTLAKAMIRARAEVRSTKKPIGTFLFLGPTGVGKTETAKTLAATYFGSEDHMVRLDMSEFQGADGVSRLIGSAAQPAGRLTSLISDHPFTVLLLDEFEKAAPPVHQLFLQVLDEGHLTDAGGRQYSFLHTIIIATSNAGAEMIRQEVKDGIVPDGFDEKLKDYILSQNLLRPELLNRFDATITYTPLNTDHIRQIAGLMMRSLNKRLDAEHGITVKVTAAMIDYLVGIGYNPEFGARPMTRAIQDTVEYYVAQKIVKGEFEPGQELIIDPQQLSAIKQ